MPDKLPLNVCVLALTCGQHVDLEPSSLRQQALEAGEEYNITTMNHVYGQSPDEWAPFADGHHVLKHIAANGFQVNPLSSYLSRLEESKTLDELVRKVDLYILDPFFLALGGRRRELVNKIEGALRNDTAKRKSFCIFLPRRLPEPLRSLLSELCLEKLQLLRLSYREGRGEWEIEHEDRFNGFLSRLRADLEGLPSFATVRAARDILVSLGVAFRDIQQPPSM